MMNAADVKALLAAVTLDQVMSVYSGKVGRCYCGCSGNHRYASKHREAASKDRGYPVFMDEVNDRQVKKIFKIVKENFAYDHETCKEGMQPYNIQGEDEDRFVTHFTAEVEGRSYTIYLLPKS
jgi:hypothetical protein